MTESRDFDQKFEIKNQRDLNLESRFHDMSFVINLNFHRPLSTLVQLQIWKYMGKL